MKFFTYLLAFSWSFFIALFAIPSIVYVAHLKNILDQPNKRTVHVSLTPRLGGLGVFAGFMSALTIFGVLDNGVQQVLAGCIILFFAGMKDDLVSISAFKKFFMQVLATGIVMFIADIRITSFQGIFGIEELPVGLSYGFTFFTIVGVTNAINLIDGLDGLAGTVVTLIVATFGFLFYYAHVDAYSNYAGVAVCLIGGLLGFLRYNFYKARIFMGDTGSLLCGFVVSIMAIQFIEMHRVESLYYSGDYQIYAAPAVALGILFVPLFDTIRVSVVRIIQGVSPFAPDKNHIHHRILAMGFSQVSTVLILAALNLVVSAFVLAFSHWGNLILLLCLLGFSIVLSFVLGQYKPKPVATS